MIFSIMCHILISLDDMDDNETFVLTITIYIGPKLLIFNSENCHGIVCPFGR